MKKIVLLVILAVCLLFVAKANLKSSRTLTLSRELLESGKFEAERQKIRDGECMIAYHDGYIVLTLDPAFAK